MTREEMLMRLATAHGEDSDNYMFFENQMYEVDDLEDLFDRAYNLTEWD